MLRRHVIVRVTGETAGTQNATRIVSRCEGAAEGHGLSLRGRFCPEVRQVEPGDQWAQGRCLAAPPAALAITFH